MARQIKLLPARKPRDRSRDDDDSLLLRSAESLGRVIGALQRQLDGATRRLSHPIGDGEPTPARSRTARTPARSRTAVKSPPSRKASARRLASASAKQAPRSRASASARRAPSRATATKRKSPKKR